MRLSAARLRPLPRLGGTRIGYPGIALMIAGSVMLLAAFTVVNWYPGSRGADSEADITFKKLHALAGSGGTPAISQMYFNWLCWALLILAIVVAMAANFPSVATESLRIFGFALGLTGAAITYLVLEQPHRGTTGSAFDHAQYGVWLALAGFLVIGLGAALGPLSEQQQ